MNSSAILPNRNLLLLIAAGIALLASLVLPGAAYAQVDTFEFDTEEQQDRFRTLSDELRCPMCQNSSLSGSTGGVAEDLRREIHRMIMEGMSDSEINQFMFDRYGDFILFRPRLTAATVLLWFGPLLFLLIGGLIAFGIWRRARKITDSDTQLDKSQQERLKQLLGDKT
ncbi:MAG: cytochrome c-type biogenesis protein CcmH [Gammaproteobacteria bacterium]|nr:cytochrome c-type biogenesis protein CcmH [Gammaproteobacteria bacterium]